MNIDYRSGIIELIELQDFRHFTTLVFNRDITANGARHFLRELHARLDRKTLGTDWAKMDPITERLFSISFMEHPTSNLHWHMLWRSTQHEAELKEAMPAFWEKLVPSGNVKTLPIWEINGLSWYNTKELTLDSYIPSSVFSSIPSRHGVGNLSNAG
jgi:hypothetical protein